MIRIDGDYGEGGGQIVRTALALSTITGKPFKITNIRKGRKVAGLKAQHLHCIRVLKELCDAKTNEINVGSEYLEYTPAKIKGRTILVDIGTAGSITLLLQAVLLPCLFSKEKVRLKIKGGTDVKWSMPIDYFCNVLLPYFKKYADIECLLEKRGYYPKGGGKIDMKIISKGSEVPVNQFERGKLIAIKGISNASKHLSKAEVAERQARAARIMLSSLNVSIRIETHYAEALSAGSGICLWALFESEDFPVLIGADSLGERGKKSELVGQEASEKLIKEINSGACVDQWAADNLIPLIGLFGGRIKTSEITGHTRANIYVTEKFLDCKFIIEEDKKIISLERHNA